MPFIYVKYVDSDGEWICPIDENNKLIYANHRISVDSFFKMWKDGCVITIDPPESLGKLAKKV